MSKRLSDTDIWDKEWFMKLAPRLKCAVKLLRDKCDLSGVWSPNYTLLKMYIGEAVTEEEILTIDGGKQFGKMANGKIFCAGFIQFQNGILTSASPVHKKISSLLNLHGITYDKNSNTYLYPIYRVLDSAKVEVKVVVSEEVGEEVKEEVVVTPEPKPKTRIQKLGDIWSEFMLRETNSAFAWEAKEMPALKKIVKLLEEKLTNAGHTVTDEVICKGWRLILEKRPDWEVWLQNKWELTIIASKFNEIYTSIKNGNGKRKQGLGHIDAGKLDALADKLAEDLTRKSE